MTDSTNPERRYLLALLAVAFALACTYALITPAGYGPDEDAHFEYVQSLVESGGASITGPAAYHQPAYYWLVSPVYLLSAGQPRELRVVAIRLVSALLFLGQVVFAYLTARLMSPSARFIWLATPAFVALIPGRVWIGAVINDDNLASLAGSGLLYFLLRLVLDSQERWKPALGGGFMVLLALLSKVTAWPVVAACGLLLSAAVLRAGWRTWGTRLAGTVAVTAVTVAALLVAVVLATAQSSGTSPMPTAVAGTASQTVDAVSAVFEMVTGGRWVLVERFFAGLRSVPAPNPEPFIHQYRTFWLPLWSDDYSAPDGVYQLTLVMLLVSLAGLPVGVLADLISSGDQRVDWRRVWFTAGLAGVVVAVWLASLGMHLTAVSGTGSFSVPTSIFPPTHARYLFPALVPLAYLMALGLHRLVPSRLRAPSVVLLVCLLLYLNCVAITGLLGSAYWGAS